MKKLRNQMNQKQNTQKKSHIPFRLNFLFFIVFGLFIALIVQLAYLQIVNATFFENRIQTGQKNTVEGQAPRGMIYDAQGEILVSNKAKQAILFTKSNSMTAEEILDASNKIVAYIDITPDELTERDKKDFWLANPENQENVRKGLTDKEKVDAKGNALSNAAEYQLLVDKVKPEQINFNKPTLKVATVFTRINSAYALQPVFIKNEGVSKEEIALVGEHVAELPGISTGLDWEREYPQNDALRSILGTVSSDKTGLPEDKLKEYLSKGYALNDRVGLSYLENQYESVLRGTKSRSEITLNKENEVVNQQLAYSGEKGKNLVLTIDLDFQDKVTEIVENSYQGLLSSGKAQYSEGAYAVVMNPQTGEVLAMVGLQHDIETGKMQDDTLGTINKSFVPGSSIKGATIMAGYENNILQVNDRFVDEPIKIAGSNVKTSVFNPSGSVSLNPIEALTVSSNVYMMKLTMAMMGVEYTPNMTLPDRTDVFETLRKTYQDFGLGTSTGIDLSGESTGLSPTNYYDEKGNLIDGRMGNLLDLSFGNFDTYTPMQLAQYVSTVANGGSRIAPRLVKGVYSNDTSGGLGNPEQLFTPTVLNEVASREYLSVVQDGFYSVVNSSDYRRTGAGLQGAKYPISAKTGTAETPIANPNNSDEFINLINSTMVAYDANTTPEIAVAVVLPHITDDSDGYHASITKQIFNAYYDFTH